MFGKAEGVPLDLRRHLESLGGNVRHLQDGSVTMAHLYPVLEIPPDPSGTPDVSELKGCKKMMPSAVKPWMRHSHTSWLKSRLYLREVCALLVRVLLKFGWLKLQVKGWL